MNTKREQRGMTLIGWVLVAGVAGFIVTFGLKLIPLYMEQIRIDTVLEDVQKKFEAGGANQRLVRESVAGQLAVNDVSAIKSSDLLFKNEDGKLMAGFTFEQRTNFIANIDLVVYYDRYVEMTP